MSKEIKAGDRVDMGNQWRQVVGISKHVEGEVVAVDVPTFLKHDIAWVLVKLDEELEPISWELGEAMATADILGKHRLRQYKRLGATKGNHYIVISINDLTKIPCGNDCSKCKNCKGV